MAVVLDPKFQAPKKDMEHTPFYTLGTRIEQYLCSNGPRAKGGWLRRNAGNKYEDRMHLVTMLRFYRFCRFMTTKQIQYALDSSQARVGRVSRSPSTHWYAHNTTVNFKVEYVDTDEDQYSKLVAPEPDAFSVYVPLMEKRPNSNKENNSSIGIIAPDGEYISIPAGTAEFNMKMQQFLEWVRNVCPEPTEEIAKDPKLLKKYDQRIWNRIFEVISHEEWMM